MTLNLNLAGAAKEEKPQKLDKAIEQAKGQRKEDLSSFASALRKPEAPEAVATNPEDIYMVPFRLISATTVGSGSWQSTTFPEQVLRDAANMLLNKPVFMDHSDEVDDSIGVVQSVSFTERYIQDDGEMIPAGIDGMLAINTSIPKGLQVAKMIEMNGLCSNSVTVQFEWEPSVDFADEDLFWWNLGNTIDGVEVSRNVTRVLDFHETSIVTLGADPYAKKIDADGNLVNIDKANSVGAIDLFEKASNDEEKKAALEGIKGLKKFTASYTANPVVAKYKAQEATQELAANFGASLEELVDQKCETEGLAKADVIASMAEAAEITDTTVKQYLKGGTACPKASYLGAWAPILGLEVEALIKLAQADGCEFKEADISALLEAAKDDKEEMADDKEYEKEMACDEDKEEMAKEEKEGYSKAEFDKQAKELEDLKALYEKAKAEKESYAKQVADFKAKGLESQIESLSKQALESKAEYQKALKESVLAQASVSSWKNRFEAAIGELDALKLEHEKQANELSEFKANAKYATIGKEHFEAQKAAAKRMYVASQAGNAKDAVIALFDKVESLDELNGLAEQYGKELTTQFAVRCKDCNSTNCEFGSVVGGVDKTDIYKQRRIMTDEELRRNYNK